jgi:hypothetical protein
MRNASHPDKITRLFPNASLKITPETSRWRLVHREAEANTGFKTLWI